MRATAYAIGTKMASEIASSGRSRAAMREKFNAGSRMKPSECRRVWSSAWRPLERLLAPARARTSVPKPKARVERDARRAPLKDQDGIQVQLQNLG